jgi:hypothetical protein
MKMKIKLLSSFQIIIIVCIFHNSFSSDDLILNSETVKKNYTDNNLVLKLENRIALKDYILIKIKGFESEMTPHIIELCKTEDSNSRFQLAHNPSNFNYLWMTKEQFEEDVFLKVSSPKEKCDYELEITTSDKLNMFKDSIYTYYVSNNNKNMTFTFPIHSFLKEEDNQHFNSITIWIIGKNIEHSITEGEIINYIEEDGKSIYNLKITNVEYIEVKIGAEENCLVTIGSTLVHDNNYPNNVSLNNSEVYGYLTTDSEEQRKMCYTFTEKSFNFTNKNWFFISMRLFSDVGQIIFTSFNSDYYDTEIIDNGYVNYILNVSECKNFIYCINIPDDTYYDIDKIIYSIQISQNNNYSSLLYNPQMLGEFYPRSLQENEFASFIGMNPFKIKDTIRYNIISDTELIDIFFYICDNYPLCFYDDSSINKSIVLSKINLVSSHSAIYNESMTPISPTQNILMVKCKADLNAPSDSSLLMRNSMCKYNTIIYSNDDYIGLLHNRMFNQYIIMNETEKYKIS